MSKKPALILIPVGYAFTAIYYVITIIIISVISNQLEDDISNILGITSVILIVFLIIGLIIMLLALYSLRDSEKSIMLGVLTIIFVSAIGGIFYLIWNPNRTHDEESIQDKPIEEATAKPIQEKPVEQPIEKEETINPYESLEKLKKLLDSGIIDKETYDAKAKKYIDML